MKYLLSRTLLLIVIAGVVVPSAHDHPSIASAVGDIRSQALSLPDGLADFTHANVIWPRSHLRIHRMLVGLLLSASLPIGAQVQWNVGAGVSAITPQLLGATADRPFGALTVGWELPIHDFRHVSFKWAPEVMPFFAVHEPHQEGGYFFNSHGKKLYRVNQGPATIFGAGATPIKFRWELYPDSRLSLYFDFGGGFVLSTKPIPYQVEDGTRFNFTIDFGGGVSFRVHTHDRFAVGVQWIHLSDAGRSVVNPGFDGIETYIRYRFPIASKLPITRFWSRKSA